MFDKEKAEKKYSEICDVLKENAEILNTEILRESVQRSDRTSDQTHEDMIKLEIASHYLAKILRDWEDEQSHGACIQSLVNAMFIKIPIEKQKSACLRCLEALKYDVEDINSEEGDSSLASLGMLSTGELKEKLCEAIRKNAESMLPDQETLEKLIREKLDEMAVQKGQKDEEIAWNVEDYLKAASAAMYAAIEIDSSDSAVALVGTPAIWNAAMHVGTEAVMDMEELQVEENSIAGEACEVVQMSEMDLEDSEENPVGRLIKTILAILAGLVALTMIMALFSFVTEAGISFALGEAMVLTFTDCLSVCAICNATAGAVCMAIVLISAGIEAIVNFIRQHKFHQVQDGDSQIYSTKIVNDTYTDTNEATDDNKCEEKRHNYGRWQQTV